MLPIILTFRYTLPSIDVLSDGLKSQGELKDKKPVGVIRNNEAKERTRVFMCDASPIGDIFPELFSMTDEKVRTQKLMESLGLLFHMARCANANKQLSNPLALVPTGETP